MTEVIYSTISDYVTEVAQSEEPRRVSVSGVLKILGVSRSGYISWCNRLPSKSKLRKEAVKSRIKDIHDDSKQNYGAPKITKVLQSEGEVISERTVGTYMKEMDVKAQWVRPWTKTTRNSDFSSRLQNLLNREFNPEHPDAVWCSDITYIWTVEGYSYLTTVMDLFSRCILSWTLTQTLDKSCVIEAINKAKNRRGNINPKLIHSDRGSQYVSFDYVEAAAGSLLSYSDKGNPYDNACIESFHSLIKREWLSRFQIRNHMHARGLVFEYIDTFYNTVRIHSHCDYLSPAEFEEMYRLSKEIELQKAS